ncbi:MAG: hypothetical protein AAB956_01780, partial [Patescibacteria group bacterium]
LAWQGQFFQKEASNWFMVAKDWPENILLASQNTGERIVSLPQRAEEAVNLAVKQGSHDLALATQNLPAALFASGQNFMSWPETIKNFYLRIDDQNEKSKSRLAQWFSRAGQKMAFNVQETIDNFSVPRLFSWTYEKYLATSWQVGNSLINIGQTLAQAVQEIGHWPERLAINIVDKIDNFGGQINRQIAKAKQGLNNIFWTAGWRISHIAYGLTQYGQLGKEVNSFFSRNIAQKESGKITVIFGNASQEEIDKLQEQVDELKIALAELKFNQSLTQKDPAASPRPAGQIIVFQSPATLPPELSFALPINYVKDTDLAALESKVLTIIGSSQQSATQQSANYTTNNFYSWAPTQRIDNLGNVTITNGTISGSFVGSVHATGVLTASGGANITGGNLTVGGDNFVVDTDGNLDMIGNLTIGGSQTLTGNFTVNGSSVLGSSTATSSLAVNGPVTLIVASSTTALAITQYGVSGS